jgi:hypothetical protein
MRKVTIFSAGALAVFACRDFRAPTQHAAGAGGADDVGSEGRYAGAESTTADGGSASTPEPDRNPQGAAATDVGGASGDGSSDPNAASPLAGEGGAALAGVGGGGAAGQTSWGYEGGAAGELATRPFCTSVAGIGHPVVGYTYAHDIAAGLKGNGEPFVLFASQPTTNIVTLSWLYGVEPGWTPWSCFDEVLRPQRVAAGNWVDHRLQVYATTANGTLHVRQSSVDFYEPWATIPTPSRGSVTDIAVVDSGAKALYVALADGIFSRARTSAEHGVIDAAWQNTGLDGATRIAVAVVEGGRHKILAVGADAGLREGTQLDADTADSFAYSDGDFGSPGMQFADVEFARSATGQLQAFAVLLNGHLLMKTMVVETWGEWVSVQGAPLLLSIAAGGIAGLPPYLFGIDRLGIPYLSTNAGVSWAPRL